MDIQSSIKLTEAQNQALAIIRQGPRHFLCYGGSRSGKTFLLVFCIVRRALAYPGSRHLIYRLRIKEAINSVWLDTLPKVIELIPGLNKMVTPNETRHVMKFANGSEIWVGGVDDARFTDSILGQEYATIYANEASQIPYLTAWKVRTRLAQKVAGCQAREFVDLNPTSIGHWTFREFVKHVDPVRSKPGQEVAVDKPESFAVYQINPGSNIANIDADYLDTLAHAPDSMRKRFYEGEYARDNELVVFQPVEEGIYIWADFVEWTRLVRPENVRFTAGLDIGFVDADGFSIIAYSPADRKRWLIYEYKQRRTGLEQLAQAVKKGIEWATLKTQELGMSDNSIMVWCDTGGGGAKMVYDLRNQHGLPVRPAYKRDKLSAIELLQDEIRHGYFMIPADGAFYHECESIVWTKNPDTGDIIRQIDDNTYHPDMMDSILYAMRYVWISGVIRY